MIDRIVFTSDWHCGSRWGLTPPQYQSEFTVPRVTWLWNAWEQFWAWVMEFGPVPDLHCILGDLIDGPQRRSDGTTLITTALDEQVDIAMAVHQSVQAWLPYPIPKIIRVKGTPYHESFHGPLRTFDERFGIKPPPDPEQEIVLDLDVGGTIINMKHNPEGSAALYFGTIQDRELLWAKVTEANCGLPEAQILVRGHLHFKSRHDGHGKVILNLPSWALQMPYALIKRRYRYSPSIGGLLLERDARADFGWRIYWKMFPVPTLEPLTYANL